MVAQSALRITLHKKQGEKVSKFDAPVDDTATTIIFWQTTRRINSPCKPLIHWTLHFRSMVLKI